MIVSSHVLEEVERLAEIVESLFALSRLDVGEASAEWRRFDLAELAATTAEQMSLLATDKNVRVACHSDPGVMVEGDPARLKQVIVNLLDNAIKYTAPGGRVRLTVRREQGGAGLGLAIVKSICSAHGAEIEVVSALGKGSTFRLRQPLAGDASVRA